MSLNTNKNTLVAGSIGALVGIGVGVTAVLVADKLIKKNTRNLLSYDQTLSNHSGGDGPSWKGDRRREASEAAMVSLRKEIGDVKLAQADILRELKQLRVPLQASHGSLASFHSAVNLSDDDDEAPYLDCIETLIGGGSDAENLHIAASASQAVTSNKSDNEFFREIDQLLDSDKFLDKREAFEKMLQVQHRNAEDVNFMWRLARAAFLSAQQLPNEERKHRSFKAKDIAYAALALDDRNPDAHKWCAVTLGNISTYQSVSDKIKSGYVFKGHVEEALKLRPNDALLHHMLGRYCFSVVSLSWIERKLASTFFAEPPTSSIEEAIDCFEKAEELLPNQWKDNLLYLAKCKIMNKEISPAIGYLLIAKDLPVNNNDDKLAQVSIESLLKQQHT